MSTIRTSITAALADAGLSYYASQAEPVIAALEGREDNIIARLRATAETYGLADGEIEGILIDCGLVEEPTPEPVVAEGTQSIEAMIATLTEEVRTLSGRLDTAANQASRHGIRF